MHLKNAGVLRGSRPIPSLPLRRIRFLFILAAVWLSGCRPENFNQAITPTPTPVTDRVASTPVPSPLAAAEILEYTPEFVPADCAFPLPDSATSARPGGRPEVACGYLVVPENRLVAHPLNIRLHVAIFHTASRFPAKDPVVYLAGGPGGNALDSIGRYYNQAFGDFLTDRDVIVFDQRGTGYSQPSLACPRFEEAFVKLRWRVLDPAEGRTILLAGVEECRVFLERKGIDLSAYNTAENAADVNDLRIALGYDTWNLLGVSYGTKLALTVMRDFPTGVRRVILDSTYPLEVGLYSSFPANTDRVLEALFTGCANDPACNEAYPDLRKVFYDTVARLDAKPVTLLIPDVFSRNPSDLFLGEAERIEFILRGGGLMQFVFGSMYVNSQITELPRTIYDVSRGDYTVFENSLIYLIPEDVSVSWGMYFAVQCRDEVPFETPELLQAGVLAHPDAEPMVRNSEVGSLIFDICAGFDVAPADPIENEPVTSNIPTLVLAGGYDPITPPAWGEQTAAELSNSTYIYVEPSGHGVAFQNACAMGVAQAFLENNLGASTRSCLDHIPDFAFHIPLEEITMVPFFDPGTRLEGVHPVGWEEFDAGTYFYYDIYLLQFYFENVDLQSIPELAEELRLSMVADTGVDSEAILLGTRSARGRTWSIYEFVSFGDRFFLALSTTEYNGPQILVILINAPSSDREILYNEVLLPAIDAFDIREPSP